ncbi:Aldose 1-epimerase [Thermoproteus uzoniensis 768-20]|uniref:Aldose 1-epimerase n=1 Tax=Thermoproteus uzoniensis (strain 768-20) TaxID=999630 RepID=F2L5A0_THEU7|nr:aldose 1-epimerase [Thermoproteus uzoniensis]AEA13525.1 Aldose 1-epimerase [Thermoproteus uzoniensis 768-20]
MITLRSGQTVAVLHARGAYLSSLRQGGRDIVLPGSVDSQTRGGMALLIPFANRVKDGVYELDGVFYELPKSAEGHAIHGLAMSMDWALAERGDDFAEFQLELSHPGYPSTLSCAVRYELSENSLSVSLSIVNAGRRRAPLVVGAHPYFVVSRPWRLRAENPLRCVAVGKIPTGELVPHSFGVEGDYDDCFLVEGDPVILESPYSVVEMRRRNMPYIQVYTGVEGAVAVEPMSGAPDAYHNGMGLKILGPGEAAEFSFEIYFKAPRG